MLVIKKQKAAMMPLFLILLTQPCVLYAQSQAEEIIVVSSRIPLPEKTIGQSVAVLSKDEIDSVGHFSLVDVLRQVSGVSATRNGGAGSVSAVRIRGEEGFRTLTVIDGLRIVDPSNTQVATQLEHLMSGGIERVEVLKGPHGLSYGADAGGVLNIQTLNRDLNNSVDLAVEGGGMGTQSVKAKGQINTDGIFAALTASSFDSEGINQQVSDTVLADLDGYNNQTFHGTLGVQTEHGVTLQWTGRYTEGETDYDACFAASLTNHCRADYRMSAQRLALDWQGESLNHSVAFSTVSTEREFFANGGSSFSAEGKSERLDYIGSFQPTEKVRFIAGADLQKLEDSTYQRDNLGFFVESIYQAMGGLHLSAGLRHDDNDDFGQHDSYRFSASYNSAFDSGILKYLASYGTGFRAPSLYEVGFNEGSFAFPPASQFELSEEKSQGYEIGLQWFGENVDWQLTWFDQEITNAIEFDLSSFSGYLQTSGNSYSKGLESSVSIKTGEHLSLNANYTYNKTGRPDGSARLRRPKHILGLGAQYSVLSDKLRLNAWYRHIEDSRDEVFGLSVPLDDYQVFDFVVHYQLNKTLNFSLRVENALDDNYQEVYGFNAPKRAVYMGFRLSFSK